MSNTMKYNVVLVLTLGFMMTASEAGAEVAPAEGPEAVAPAEIPEAVAPAAVPEAVAPVEIPEAVAPAAGPEPVAPAAGQEPVAPAAGQEPVAPAASQELPMPDAVAAQPEAENIWYGGQILVLDAIVVMIALAADNPGVLVIGGLTGGPLIHMLMDNSERALSSLALRAGLPFLTGLLVYNAECAGKRCHGAEAVVGAGLGMILASVLDTSWLARKRIVPQPALGGVTVVPSVVTSPAGGLTIGLGGAF